MDEGCCDQSVDTSSITGLSWLASFAAANEKKAGVESGGACPKVVVQAKTAWLYNDPSLTERYRQISFNTVLPLAAEDGDILTVATPADGFKWIDKKDVLIRGGEAGKAVTGQEVSELARQFFLGLPYLWAGTSGFGFDCSGFTYSLYGFYGISIPRDAKDQAKFGQKKVDPSRLSPGDLLFYAREEGKGAVHHVAMYIGNGQMIHSPKTERSVEMISMNTPEYAVEYAVARRVIP